MMENCSKERQNKWLLETRAFHENHIVWYCKIIFERLIAKQLNKAASSFPVTVLTDPFLLSVCEHTKLRFLFSSLLEADEGPGLVGAL